jgi:dUTP pyrophosphatase
LERFKQNIGEEGSSFTNTARNPTRNTRNSTKPIKEFYYSLNHESSVPPVKQRDSDAGFDLTLVSVHKTVGNTVFYNTGVSVEPPKGMYFDLVARSSITKTGYMLANSIGIIDNEYRGDILVALVKIDKDAEDLTLPNRLVQIIPRYCLSLTPVQKDFLSSTDRDTKGFGSSNPTSILKQ